MTPIAIEAASRPHSRSFMRRFAGAPLPWIMPVIIVIGIFYLYPMIDVFRLSFTNATLIGDNQDYTLGSIANMLSSPQLPDILWATVVFVGGSVIGQQLLGLAVAVVVVRGEKRGLFGTTILRTTALIAWVVPGIAGGIIWQMLFSEAPYGALNSILRLMHLPTVAWLSDPAIAPWSALISNIWRGTAFSMVVMYAALKSIDPSLYEAAEVDGATGPQQFFFITIPQLRAAMLVNMILITIMTLNTFDAIITLTGGGPGRATEVISLYVFNIVFRNYDLSGGSVLSVLMLIISLGLACVYAAFLPKEDEQ
ncbi:MULTISPECIES: sugar ABC transporter permease [unclassified Rhizobium]|jgi:multiple sugar transport system permease protein|uniref:carbohydrate ABC transporter permease n=1 Tax=unclassified Rhizobium TaxID=2613769 RepID=UPI000647D088|nr:MULTISPECIES: sugar ABC transporter permease [unclassified Rhizobium]MBN8949162.1 sugar ABC transporter permease [Rhizobium tropici]OJY78840.1 MAG: ABC transporter permease [Rhizobium sp. 60-20]RKD35846.1 carbohydrate ABC transporter membrane protein 1 (CUT1 family) [Rhizobium sp. WW_1]